MTNDRRFADCGFKRQTPVGPHIVDFVSFALRMAIELVPQAESAELAQARAQRRQWLTERDYKVIEVGAADVENDVAGVLDRILAAAAR
jgi:tRNA/rRNA methyltransferase